MIDKEKYPKLAEVSQGIIDQRLRWFQEAVHAKYLAETLPEEIKVMDIKELDYCFGKLSITVGNEQETLKTLKMLGVQGLKPKVTGWSKAEFHSSGDGILPNGTKFTITVSDIGKPEGCEVIEKLTSFTERTLVCANTGKEI